MVVWWCGGGGRGGREGLCSIQGVRSSFVERFTTGREGVVGRGVEQEEGRCGGGTGRLAWWGRQGCGGGGGVARWGWRGDNKGREDKISPRTPDQRWISYLWLHADVEEKVEERVEKLWKDVNEWREVCGRVERKWSGGRLWNNGGRLWKSGGRLWKSGGRLRKSGGRLWKSGGRLWKSGGKLWRNGEKMDKDGGMKESEKLIVFIFFLDIFKNLIFFLI